MLNLQAIAESTGGKILNPRDQHVSGFSLDSRDIKPGDFFITLPGNRTDGTKFLPEAFRKGASGALVDSTGYEGKFPNLIPVEDREQALLQMASFYRSNFSIPIVGITGSWGKTTTKELTASLLSEQASTYISPGNLNTEYGLPLSLLNMPEGVDFGVFELGLRLPGDIKTLSQILRPTIGVITGIGKVHLKNFKDNRHLAREKFQITEGMDQKPKLILNLDSEYVRRSNSKFLNHNRSSYYSLQKREKASYVGKNVRIKGLDGIALKIVKRNADRPSKSFHVSSKLLSKGNAYNLLAASSVGLELGISPNKIVKGCNLSPLPQRLNPIQFSKGYIIDDSYNSNPRALKNSLDLLKSITRKGQKTLILADMLELGQESEELHKNMAPFVIRSGADLILCTGRFSEALSEKVQRIAAQQGLEQNILSEWYPTKDELIRNLPALLESDHNIILVKGSRANKMEEIVQNLENL